MILSTLQPRTRATITSTACPNNRSRHAWVARGS
jgi:hypothetical protein